MNIIENIFNLFTTSLFHIATPMHYAIFALLIAASIWTVQIFFFKRRLFNESRLRSSFQTKDLYEYIQQNKTNINQLAAHDLKLESRMHTDFLRECFDYIKKSGGTAGLDEFVDLQISESRKEVSEGLSILATIGANAPFIGLLGTVFGIMQGFRSLAENTAGGQQQVMAGISEALIATAVGLIVALVAVGFYNFFQKKAKDYISKLLDFKLAMQAALKENQ